MVHSKGTETMDDRKGANYFEEDQRVQLSRSHQKTLSRLEQAAYAEDIDLASVRKPTLLDPQDQILPSSGHIAKEDSEARQRGKTPKELYGVLPYKDISKFVRDEVESQNEESSNESKELSRSRAFTARRIVFLTFALAALSGVLLVLTIPSTRAALDKALSQITKETEQAIVHNSRQMIQPFFPPTSLEDLTDPNYDGLLSPVYYPLISVQPILWMIPNSGSNAVKDILSYCMKLVLSDERAQKYPGGKSLSVRSDSNNVGHFVDVDTTAFEGLQRAMSLGLVESGLADVVATPYVNLAAELFRPNSKMGRILATFRHPVDRIIAEFLELKNLPPQDPRYNEHISQLQLHQYAHSSLMNENPMVKVLANMTTSDAVTHEHVAVAASILERYVVIGLWEHMAESMERFYDHFDWERPEAYQVCQASFISMHQEHQVILDPRSDEYATLKDRNWADMMLWERAKEIWESQRKFQRAISR